MKTIFSLILMFLLNYDGFAQKIALDSVLIAGFYKNIQELVDNSPSYPFNYEVTSRKVFGENVLFLR